MKKAGVSVLVLFLILFMNIFCVNAVQIYLNGSQIDQIVEQVRIIKGWSTGPIYHFGGTGGTSVNTLDQICFLANYSNHPLVYGKRIISASYIALGPGTETNAGFSSCSNDMIISYQNSNWQNYSACGNLYLKLSPQTEYIICDVEYAPLSGCKNLVFYDYFSTDPNNNPTQWTVTHNPAYQSSIGNSGIWENNKFTLTKAVDNVQASLVPKYTLNSKNWSVEFDFSRKDEVTSDWGMADGIYLNFYGYLLALENIETPPDSGSTPGFVFLRNHASTKKQDNRIADGNTHHALINFDNGHITLKLDNDASNIIDYVIPNINYPNSVLDISASCGVINAKQIIDNFKVYDNTCPAKTCASDYPGLCGGSLADGIGGTLNCSTNCPSGQQCNIESGVCYTPNLGHTCIDTNQTIIKLSSPSLGNGSLFNSTGDYSICFNEIFGYNYSKNIHECNINNTPILYLNSSENGRASLTNTGAFNISVCFGNLTCRTNSYIHNYTNGLVAYYPFNIDANDSSGNNHNGTVNGGANLVTGKSGNAYEFDGLNDYIDIGNIDFTKNYTFSMWIYLTAYPDGSVWRGILTKHDETKNENEINFRFITNSEAQFYDKNPSEFISYNTSEFIPLNQWVYITGIRNNSELSLYFNGIKRKTATVTSSTISSATSSTKIGAQISSQYQGYFAGKIDELKIWNRTLSDQEIIYEYSGTSSSTCNSTEKSILKLNSNTGSLLSNGSYSSSPISVCCWEMTPPIVTVSGNASFQNLLNETITTSNIYDTVWLVVNRSNILGLFTTYTLYQKEGAIWKFFFGDTKVAQFTGYGYANYTFNQTGEYYFNATVSGYSDVYSSYTITVGNKNNKRPTVTITRPKENSTFIVKDGSTSLIRFEQIANDEDDFLDGYWNFDDTNTTRINNCNVIGGNCNINHSYLLAYSGARIVNLTVIENTRPPSEAQSEFDRSRIYVYKEGLNLFMIIDSPNYKLRNLSAGPVTISAASTHVANCSTNFASCNVSAYAALKTCYNITDAEDNVTKLYCYKYAESSSPKFKFNWTIDGLNDPSYPTNATPFVKIFPQGGEHSFGLYVTVNLSASG